MIQRTGLHPCLLLALPVLLLLLAGCSGSPQATPTVSIAVPSDASPSRFTYVAMGASDAFGVGAADPTTQSWPADLARLLPVGSRFVNLGIPGITLHQALTQELPVALSIRPNLVTIWLGVNDLDADVPLEQYQHDLGILLGTLATKTHATVAVGNIPDLTLLPAFADQDPVALRAEIATWNQVIAIEVRRHHDLLVDLYQGTAAFATNPEDISDDGLHPTEEGYQLIATAFAQVLRAHHVIP